MTTEQREAWNRWANVERMTVQRDEETAGFITALRKRRNTRQVDETEAIDECPTIDDRP